MIQCFGRQKSAPICFYCNAAYYCIEQNFAIGVHLFMCTLSAFPLLGYILGRMRMPNYDISRAERARREKKAIIQIVLLYGTPYCTYSCK